jgi:hypothetical protein
MQSCNERENKYTLSESVLVDLLVSRCSLTGRRHLNGRSVDSYPSADTPPHAKTAALARGQRFPVEVGVPCSSQTYRVFLHLTSSSEALT